MYNVLRFSYNVVNFQVKMILVLNSGSKVAGDVHAFKDYQY